MKSFAAKNMANHRKRKQKFARVHQYRNKLRLSSDIISPFKGGLMLLVSLVLGGISRLMELVILCVLGEIVGLFLPKFLYFYQIQC